MSEYDDFVVDLGATHHVLHVEEASAYVDGEATTVRTLGGEVHAVYKNAAIRALSSEGVTRLKLRNALITRSSNVHLLSLVQLAANGWEIELQHARLRDPDGATYNLMIINNLYILRTLQTTLEPVRELTINFNGNANDRAAFTSQGLGQLSGMRLLHLRLGHFSEQKIAESIKKGAKFGKEAINARPTDKAVCCHGCQTGKATQPHKQRQPERGTRPGNLVHCDLKTDLTPSPQGHKHFIHFMDDATRFVYTYPMRAKSDSSACLLRFLAEARSEGHEITRILSDNDTVLQDGEFKALCTENKIALSQTPSYDGAAGGRHERVIATLWHHVHATIASAAARVGPEYWPWALTIITFSYNNLVHSTTGAIPAVKWRRLGVPDYLSMLRAFVTFVYVYQPKQLRRAKSAPRSTAYVFLGLQSPHVMYLLDQNSRKVITRGHFSRSVELFKEDNTLVTVDEVP